MRDIERELRDLGALIEWPETPDVSGRVLARLEPRRTRRTALARRWPAFARVADRWSAFARRRPAFVRPGTAFASRLAYVAAALLLLLAAVAAVPPARSAVLHWLGIRGERITRVEHLPPAGPRAPLRIGRPIGLDAASRAAGFPVLVPKALGSPDAVRFRDDIRAVTLLYRPRGALPPAVRNRDVGLLLTEFRGTSTPYVQKLAGPGTNIEPTRVGGDPGYWITGAPHELIFQAPSGQIMAEPPRLVEANVLIWEHEGIALRIETAAPRERAVAIAESLQPAG